MLASLAAWVVSPVHSKGLDGMGDSSYHSAIDIETLSSRLSPSARIYAPGTEGFAEATLRWSAFYAPSIDLVVVPATETDVAETVRLPPPTSLLGKAGADSSSCRSSSRTNRTGRSLLSAPATELRWRIRT